MTCKGCLYYEVCPLGLAIKGATGTCLKFKNKADFVEVDKISEKIIRKKSEVSDYWQNNVKNYRAMKGYSDIEHDVDNFLRGYNEAVDDMLAILDGERRTE